MKPKLNNNLGALRLCFAALVMVSHAPELKDGNRSREVLTRLFHTLSFGEVAVDGFFLISGYLITASFLRSATREHYIRNRILRIYPGFLVVSLLGLCLSPLVGGDVAELGASRIALDLALLLQIQVPNVFADNAYPALNGSLWTIAYEFRCYVLALVLGMAGLLQSKPLILALALAGLVASAAHVPLPTPHLTPLLGLPGDMLRFAAIFLCGASFYLYRDRIAYRPLLAAYAA